MNTAENRMGTEKVSVLLLKTGIPLMLSLPHPFRFWFPRWVWEMRSV